MNGVRGFNAEISRPPVNGSAGTQKKQTLRLLSSISKATKSLVRPAVQWARRMNCANASCVSVNKINVAPTGCLPRLGTERKELIAPMRTGNQAQRSLEAREFVQHSDIKSLQALGAGELTRLAHIINSDNTPGTQLTSNYKTMRSRTNAQFDSSKLLVIQDANLEAKLQKAFGRAFNSTVADPGAMVIDKILVEKYSSLPGTSLKLTEQDKEQACECIANNRGQDLEELSASELSFIANRLFARDSSSGHVVSLNNSAIGREANYYLAKALSKANDSSVTRRANKVINPVEPERPNAIKHRTTLFALINKQVNSCIFYSTKHLSLSDQRSILKPMDTICMRAAHNHVSPEQLKQEILSYLYQVNMPSDAVYLIDQLIKDCIGRFQPTNNLGIQMESPHAKKMENAFAAMVLQRPTDSMQQVAQKIIHQLKCYPEFYHDLINRYVKSPGSYFYPFTQKESMTKEQVVRALETGSNLALFVDFHLLCTRAYANLEEVKNTNNGEIPHVWNQETYFKNISEYRGARVPLPRLKSTDVCKSIGVGTHNDALKLDQIQLPVVRASTIKTAYGRHAKESAIADTAQACGTTGQGNLHLWGQALINQISDPAFKMSKKDTQVFLTMVATVMTAHGGHTLSEMLATGFIASRTARNMSEKSKRFTDEMFSHVRNITRPMRKVETRFDHFNMLFSGLNDQDTDNYLDKAWKLTVNDV